MEAPDRIALIDLPARVRERLGAGAPPRLAALGNRELLALPRTALLCSARCPGDPILAAFDEAMRLRESGRCVVSGFHSTVEQGCLEILLRGSQPIIVCPARAMESMRVPGPCRAAFDAGRLLYLSPFENTPTRPTKASAHSRNLLVAALADDAFIPHAAPGGGTEHIAGLLREWRVPGVQ
ncbi:MAG: DNA-binding protein [Candidatus Hydrogenedentes bacterium]|nr:DNA-binding protein [Candidatus Hydrogenedentota bacterium]